jgi:hypothetical protein
MQTAAQNLIVLANKVIAEEGDAEPEEPAEPEPDNLRIPVSKRRRSKKAAAPSITGPEPTEADTPEDEPTPDDEPTRKLH